MVEKKNAIRASLLAWAVYLEWQGLLNWRSGPGGDVLDLWRWVGVLKDHWGSGHLWWPFLRGDFFFGGEKNAMLQKEIQVDENDEMPTRNTWEAILDQHCLPWFSAYFFGIFTKSWSQSEKSKHRERWQTCEPKFILFSEVLAVGGGIHGFRWSVLAFRHLPHVWEVPTAYSAVSSDDSVVSLLQALRLGSSRDVTLCDLGFVGLTVDIFWLNNMSTCRFVGFFPRRKDSVKGREYHTCANFMLARFLVEEHPLSRMLWEVEKWD